MKLKSEIRSLLNDILRFRDERDWGKFHDAKNLAFGIAIRNSHGNLRWELLISPMENTELSVRTLFSL